MRIRLASLAAAVAATIVCLASASAAATTCANREAPAYRTDSALVEIAVLCETNNRRLAEGLPPLRLNAQLSAAGRAHAQDMATRGYFDHYTPEGAGPTERAAAQGYVANGCCGENIAYGYGDAQNVVNGWMDSPGHRANILGGAYQEIGVGVFDDQYVQVFSGGLLAPGVTGLEPEYQGSAGRDPRVEMFVTRSGAPTGAVKLNASTDSSAPLSFTAVQVRTGAVRQFVHAGNGVESLPLAAGVWHLCWELVAADPYAGASGCVAGDVRIEATAGVTLLALSAARVDLLAGQAGGQAARLLVQQRVRRCARCRLSSWRTVRQFDLTLRDRQRLWLGHWIGRAARARAVLDVPAFERDGLPYASSKLIVSLRRPVRAQPAFLRTRLTLR